MSPISNMPKEKTPNYYAGGRHDLLALVPTEAARVLDVGCGAGVLGEALKASRPCVVIGIELNQEAATTAAQVLDQVICAPVETLSLEALGRDYDCIIFGDVLEHLADPWELVRRYRRLLTPQGVMVASIPNIGHWTVIADLLRGRWEYRTRGLLDSTHLRFFTARSVRALFEDAGLTIVRWERNFRLIERDRRYAKVARWLGKGPLRELFTFQYLVVARRVGGLEE
ncbi:MAG TPA: class I SAM-dependent methyltransferase [Caldilineaceae bacterium]|nr:class I SAM-dependent methyltransferase [Caldilineaceae bacterium]